MATGVTKVKSTARNSNICDDSSESENETEPAKLFHRRLSTNKEINRSVATKEGFLHKQTWSFNRWKRRYFKLKGHKLYYAKDPKSAIFDEIDLSNLSFAECGIKNVNHSFQVITPSRALVMCAESRQQMEAWLNALKAASNSEFYEQGADQHDFLSGHHHWYATSHAKPTYCNVCRENFPGVTSHGLSCEVCKCKVHKRCAAKAINNCKWTTLASIGKEDIIEDSDGNLTMPHQWVEGNLPVSAKCGVCYKTCGSVRKLQDWRCLWCRSTVHTACRPAHRIQCSLGPSKVSVVPPTALHSIGNDEAWEVSKPQGGASAGKQGNTQGKILSPLLVFVNSKSGDNQGVKFLRRFKQLLNPAQVFDLISSGPGLGLRLFRHFDPFRILVCSGDGSVGWVLTEIDRLKMQKQCQVAVLPLGTGNDLARVLGWGSACDDDAHLPQLLDRYEKASTKMLDRWSIMVYERSIPIAEHKMSISSTDHILSNNISQYEDSVLWHLQNILQSDESSVIVNSAKILCETIKDFVARISESSVNQGDKQLSMKCDILGQKLEMLLETLNDEQLGAVEPPQVCPSINVCDTDSSKAEDTTKAGESSEATEKGSIEKTEKDQINLHERRNRSDSFVERETLHCRANSLKRAIRNVLEHSELVIDEQNGEGAKAMDTLKVMPTIDSASSTEASPCPSPLSFTQCSAASLSSPSTLPHYLHAQSLISARLTSISPLPDLRRDSVGDEQLYSTLPVPTQFADGSSRRSSGVQQSIQEMEEAAAELVKLFPLCSTHKLDASDSQSTTVPTDLPYDDSTSTLCLEVPSPSPNTSAMPSNSTLYKKDMSSTTLCNETEQSELKPSESESNIETTNDQRRPTIPSLVVSNLEVDKPEFIYCNQDTLISDQMLIIDTDLQSPDHDSSDLFNKDGGNNVYDDREGSDVLSAISNEECSMLSEILDQKSFNAPQNSDGDDVNGHIGHIDSPETSDTTCPNSEALHGESIVDDISSVLGQDIIVAITGKYDSDTLENTYTDDTTLFTCDTVSEMPLDRKKSMKSSKRKVVDTQCGFENRVFNIDNRCDDQKVGEPIRYCSLAQFDGNDIARRSFKKYMKPSKVLEKQESSRQSTLREETEYLDTIKIEIQGSNQDLDKIVSDNLPSPPQHTKQSFEKHCLQTMFPQVSVIVEPPSPIINEDLRNQRVKIMENNISLDAGKIDGDSEHLSVKSSGATLGFDRRGSDYNPNLLGLDTEHMKFLNCSPAATRRISSGSLFKASEAATIAASANSLYGDSNSGIGSGNKDEKEDSSKRLPIINPLVQLPTWPNVSSGGGFISNALLANADTLCAAISPLMDPDETLMEGYYEKCSMNNYLGIGIDAKITLDFHHKREEHPEKCRSRAKNYMWYGVLGSKEWLQKTYKNLEQRVQLECDGQRIPLPSLQGIVVLNIPSFMGGTNFWGGKKEDDCFLAPSFDDRILEVVAVFGSVQMAASRLINLQHHRIAQCNTVQITILGDEGVPVQVDGEAWVQPPGVIRIIHKNRMQMLCRNRALETSLKAWEEKQRQHSISISREQTSTASEHNAAADDVLSEQEYGLLLIFIERTITLVKLVKFLIISHPSLKDDLYSVAALIEANLERIHPNGKIIEGSNLRTQLTELVTITRQMYQDTCVLLRDNAQSLRLQEDLETNLSVSLANMEAELRKCVTLTDGLVYLQTIAPEETERKHRKGLFWLKFRGGKSNKSATRDYYSSWGVQDVAHWLESIQLPEYIDSFTKNDIRGKELLTLARSDLKELGVIKLGHSKRILQAIKELTG